MASPLLPLMLLGVGVLVLKGRRRRTNTDKADDSSPTQQPIQTVVFIPPEDPEVPASPAEQPGQPCDAPDGLGAWDDHGTCKTFWIDGATDDAIRALAREEWDARGRPNVSELCLAVYDEMSGELGTHEANPRFTEIVVAVLEQYYDVGPVFPPTETNVGDQPTSPYWVHRAWAKAQHVIRQELCGG